MSSDQEKNLTGSDLTRADPSGPGWEEIGPGQITETSGSLITGSDPSEPVESPFGPRFPGEMIRIETPEAPKGGVRARLSRLFGKQKHSSEPIKTPDDDIRLDIDPETDVGSDNDPIEAQPDLYGVETGPDADEGMRLEAGEWDLSRNDIQEKSSSPDVLKRSGFRLSLRKKADLDKRASSETEEPISPLEGDEGPKDEIAFELPGSEPPSRFLKRGNPSLKKVKKGVPDVRGFPPIQVIIGWIGESSKRDVIEHARGFAADHMESLQNAWISMAEFRGGTLFEIHEGGGGYAYLPELIEGLSRDPDQILWVPSGTKLNRVVTFSIVEGRPFSMMLNEADSTRVRSSGQRPVDRTGKMRRLAPRGTPVLVLGATLFGIAFGSLAASAYLAAAINQQPIPSLAYNADALPHGQIVSLSNALREDRWVSRIVFENGTWRAEFETFEELVLPDDTGEAQQMIDQAVERDGILQAERDRKIREMSTE